MSLKSGLCGASVALSAGATGLGAIVAISPSTAPTGPLARILDAVAPHMFLAGLLLAGCAVVLGARWLGGALAAGAAAAGAALFSVHLGLTLPLASDRPATLRVLFFNVLAQNSASAERIVAATIAARPDVAVFAEAKALHDALDTLRDAFPFVSRCPPEACEVLVASNRPVHRFWQLQLNPLWPARYAVLEIDAGTETQPTSRLTIAAIHLAKPWMSSLAEQELVRLAAQYDWLTGPAIAVGDYNMAPWSLPMRELLARTGFRGVRLQPGSWPRRAGPLGLPIDQLLLRGGVRATAVTPFGADLGSNHRGFIADIALPPDTE